MVDQDTLEQKISLGDARSLPLLRRLLGDLVRPYARHLILALICMGVTAAMTAAFAWLMEPVINEVFIEDDRTVLWLLAGAVIGVFVLKNASAYVYEVLIGFVGQRVIADTQKRLFAHLMAQDMALFQERSSGTLISHFTYDTNAMRNAVSNAVIGLGRDSLSVIFLVGVMFYQAWLLALITLVVAPLSAHYVDRLGRSMRRVSTRTQDEMATFTSGLTESFQGIRMIKAYRLEALESRKLSDRVESILGLVVHATKIRAAVIPIIDTLGGVAMGAVIVYGGQQVIAGDMTAGAFFSFITAVGLAYQPIRALGKVNAYLQEGLAAAARIFAVLDRAPTVADPPARISAVALFGGVEVIVPRDWNVQLEVLPILGGASDDRPRRPEEHHLRLAVLAGVDLLEALGHRDVLGLHQLDDDERVRGDPARGPKGA